MDRNEHQTVIEQLLPFINPDNQADATALLTQLSDGFNEVVTTNEELQTSNEKFKTDNEKLRKVNTDLFLKTGEKFKDPNAKDTEDFNEEKLSYDDLFKEGELL